MNRPAAEPRTSATHDRPAAPAVRQPRYRADRPVSRAGCADPRSPCFNLGAKAGSPAFLGEFLNSRRLGFYLSVVEEGEVGAGDRISVITSVAGGPTLARLIEERYFIHSR
jgi:hypothetical protein